MRSRCLFPFFLPKDLCYTSHLDAGLFEGFPDILRLNTFRLYDEINPFGQSIPLLKELLSKPPLFLLALPRLLPSMIGFQVTVGHPVGIQVERLGVFHDESPDVDQCG